MQIRVGLGVELGKKGGEYVIGDSVWGPIFRRLWTAMQFLPVLLLQGTEIVAS